MFQLDKKHQKYQKYNPSNIDWIVNIPDGWNIRKIAQVCYISRGRVIAKTDMVQEWWLFPIYSSQTADNWVIWYLNSYDFDGEYLTWTTDWANAGTVFYRTGKFNATNVCWTLKVKEKISLSFLRHALSVSTKRHVREDINPKLMSNMMARISVPLPNDIHEQKRIADYLDGKTALLDEAIAKKKKQIELLGEHRIALIKNAITKWLDPNVDMIDSGIEWIGNIPKGWEVKKMKYLGKIYNGATPKSDIIDYWDWDIVWATPEDLSGLIGKYLSRSKRTITEEWYQSCWTSLVPENSIILSCRAPIWLLAINKVPLCSNQGCKSVVPNRNTHYSFLYYSLLANKSNLDAIGSGTTFKELSSKKFADFFVSIPSLTEQRQIADYLDKETKYIDDMIAKIEKSIELLEEYKASLISHVVSGKIKIW